VCVCVRDVIVCAGVFGSLLFIVISASTNGLLCYYFACAAVTVDSGRMTVSSSAAWSRFSPPSDFVSGHVSAMWFMVCRWPQSQGTASDTCCNVFRSNWTLFDNFITSYCVGKGQFPVSSSYALLHCAFPTVAVVVVLLLACDNGCALGTARSFRFVRSPKIRFLNFHNFSLKKLSLSCFSR